MDDVRKIVREVLRESFIGSDGELVDFDIRLNYPYEEIWNLIKDYYEENNKYWIKFGWSIFDAHGNERLEKKYNSKNNSFFRVEKLDEFSDQIEPVLDYLSSDEEAWEKAREAGFIVDEDGIILGLNGVNLVDKLNESKKLSVFDFDSTLVNTPFPEDGEKETGEKKDHSWWESKESLDTDVYDMEPNDDVIKDHKKELEDDDTMVVMMTGRKEKIKKHVNSIIDDLRLDFDKRLFNSGGETSKDKMDKMDKILKDDPEIEEVEMWDDRDKHIPKFQKWGDKKVEDGELKKFNINHIKESKEVKWEYQVREIGGPVYYKRKKGDKLWSFISAEEFAKDSHKGKLVKWKNKYEV